MPTCKLTRKTLSHIPLHVFCLHFLHYDYSFWGVFESMPAQFLSGNIRGLLVIFLFNYNSSKSTFSMLNMQLDVFLSSFCQINGNSFVSCNVKITKIFFFLLCVLIYIFHKNLIVLHDGYNNFLFYFEFYIKFTLSLRILSLKKWQHLTWCELFW